MKKVFVIMPFKEEFFEVYEMLKRHFGEQFEFSNAGDEANQQNILRDIFQPMYDADVVIADLTGLNPNVMYELGVAHSLNKKTIIITRDSLSELPFDLKQYRAKDYNTHFVKFDELLKYLESNIKGAVDNSVSFSNPVVDFLDFAKIEFFSACREKNNEKQEEEEKGFLDFLADIEDTSKHLGETVLKLTADMEEMSTGVNSVAVEVERRKNSGCDSMAAFVRKKSKQAAHHIDGFATKLRGTNKTIEDLWDSIENDTLGLLENKFVSLDENKVHLIAYLKSLNDMKKTIGESNVSVDRLKAKMNDLIGLERSMNHAIRFVVADLATYLSVTERIQLSIDKILGKSKFVVGMLDFAE